MGWRTVEFQLREPNNPACAKFLEQMAEFGDLHGCRPDFERIGSAEDAGWVTFELGGNSLWLNDFSEIFIEGCREIGADIALDDDELKRIINEIESQLRQQSVPAVGDGIVTLARPGREGLQRIEGEASFPALIDELELHVNRLKEALLRLRSVSGADGWRQRVEFRRSGAIDAEAVIRTARRLQRVAHHICQLLPGDHLETAYRVFMEETAGLIDLRDMTEHIDEYVVGRGRRDRADEQPGPVFEYEVADDDVIVSARDRSLGVLIAAEHAFRLGGCLEAASKERWPRVVFPAGLDMDFMMETENGDLVYVDRDQEGAEQREFHATLESVRSAASGTGNREEEAKLCPECGVPL